MPFQYKTVLVIGATSGIGLALSEKFIAHGSHVIAVGRRQENLSSMAEKHGKEKVSTAKFDITDLSGIPEFVKSITKAHPKLDSIFLNSGIQRGLDFSKPTEIDLAGVSTEFTTNYLSHIHLITAFLPFLQSQSTPTSLIFTTSNLALVPMLRCPNYCASKAAMHHLILCLREQLKGSNVKIIEILPPAVQTELHDAKHQPDIKDGRNIGMPIEEFTKEAWEGLVEGKTDVPVGTSKMSYNSWEMKRQEAFHTMVEKMKGGP